jgi:anti-anti-sigma factor
MIECEIVERDRDYVVLRLSGELAGQLWTDVLGKALDEHFVDDGVKVIRVDLSPVTFLDNNGVATLVSLHRASGERGKRFFVVNPGGQVREKLEVTGVSRFLQED